MGKVDRDVVRMARQLDITTEALDQIARYRFDPNKPVADRVRIKAKAQKALDDIRKLETQIPQTNEQTT